MLIKNIFKKNEVFKSNGTHFIIKDKIIFLEIVKSFFSFDINKPLDICQPNAIVTS